MSLVATPYEPQRRRLILMEKLEALRHGISAERARAGVARATGLTTEQLANIRKGKLKGLYGEITTRIDAAFVAAAGGSVAAIAHELELARQSARPVDPQLVAKAVASRDALEQLIREADAAGIASQTAAGPETPPC